MKYQKIPFKIYAPHLIPEIHPTLNQGINLDKLNRYSTVKLWWQCSKNIEHVWKTAIDSRVRQKTNCPYCCKFNVKATKFKNILNTHLNIVKDYWNYDKNSLSGIRPENFKAESNKVVYWTCGKENHYFKRSVRGFLNSKTKSFYCCAGLKEIMPGMSLLDKKPDIYLEWNERNVKFPDKIYCDSKTTILLNCKFGHVYKTTAIKKVKGHPECNFCLKEERQKEILKLKSLKPVKIKPLPVIRKKHESLFVKYPKLISQVHKSLNSEIDFNRSKFNRNVKIWWQCDVESDHVWQTILSSRYDKSRKRIRGCPYCCKRKKVVISNCLSTTHPELCKEWHPTLNLPITPERVSSGMNHQIFWVCSKNSSHIWKSSIRNRIRSLKNCAVCSKNKSLLEKLPSIASEFDYDKNKGLDLDNIFYLDRKTKICLKCIKCQNNWKCTPYDRFKEIKKCKVCFPRKKINSKGEEIISNILDLMGIKYDREVTIPGCKYKWHLRFDFKIYLENRELYIEYQGQQHYKRIENIQTQKDFEIYKKRDEIKRNFCRENNLELIEIPYWEGSFENLEKILKSICVVSPNPAQV